jgi:hypothetical protein
MESPAQQSTRVGRLGRWLPVVMVVAVVLALAALLAARAGGATASLLGGGGTSPNWQTYRDAGGMFTLQLPPGWTAQIEPATAWYIDNRGTEKVSDDMITFQDPSQGTGSAKLWVVADPIKNAFDHQYYCEPGHAAYQSFVAMNASTMEHLEDTDAPWFFTTENATFQIDITIPGVTAVQGYGPPPPPATPLPASWIATDQTEMQAMLTSFQPTDPKPLSC